MIEHDLSWTMLVKRPPVIPAQNTIRIHSYTNVKYRLGPCVYLRQNSISMLSTHLFDGVGGHIYFLKFYLGRTVGQDQVIIFDNLNNPGVELRWHYVKLYSLLGVLYWPQYPGCNTYGTLNGIRKCYLSWPTDGTPAYEDCGKKRDNIPSEFSSFLLKIFSRVI